MPGLAWPLTRLLIYSLLLYVTPADAGNPEHVSIQTLLSPQAASYQRHMVAVQGVATNIEVIPPSPPRPSKQACFLVYGRETFTVNDETGSLPVEVLGSCSPNALDVLPKDGETVRLTGTVHVLKTEYTRHVIVQATTIQILDSSNKS